MTRNQCRTWLNSETLWTHALTHGANASSQVHNNLGVGSPSQGKYEAADGSLHRGAAAQSRLRQKHTTTWAVVLYSPGEVRGGGGSLHRGAAAQSRLRRRTLQPGRRPHPARGTTRRRRLISPRRCGSIPAMSTPTTTWASSSPARGTTRRRRARYAEAIRLDPDYAEAYNNLAMIMAPVPKRSSATARGRSNSRPAPAS